MCENDAGPAGNEAVMKWKKIDEAQEAKNVRLQKRKWASNRYFNEFDEYYVAVSGRKKGKIVRIYTGTYYRTDESRGVFAAGILCYLLLWITSFGLTLYSVTRPWSINGAWYVTLPTACSLASLAFCGKAIVNLAISGRKMTTCDYQSSSLALRRAAAASGGILTVLLAAMLSYWIGIEGTGNTSSLAGIGMVAFAECLVILLYRMERGKRYIQEKSRDLPPENGVFIRR